MTHAMQVEGAFVQGLGLQTLEEVVFDDAGRLVTTNTWDYKIPTPADIPRQLNVTFLKARTAAGHLCLAALSEFTASGFCHALPAWQGVTGSSTWATTLIAAPAGKSRCCCFRRAGLAEPEGRDEQQGQRGAVPHAVGRRAGGAAERGGGGAGGSVRHEQGAPGSRVVV